MSKILNSQAEFSVGAKTPEEAFDRQILSGNYRMFLIVGLFLVVGVEGFIGLMSTAAVIGVASFIASMAALFLAAPLFWEPGINSNHTIRRISRAAYFPIRLWPFIFSKWKLMTMYGGVLWLFSLAIQLVFGVLFGFGNILLYQGVLAAVFLANMLFYTLIGTVGVRLGE